MRRRLALASLVCLTGPAWSAEPPNSAPGVTIVDPAMAASILTAADIAALPSTKVTLVGEHGSGPRSFEGPLLWAVLDHAHAIAADEVHRQVRQSVLLTGRDGYTAVLALGEIAPEFEGKPVILADRMDDQPLGPAHLRIVVPSDKRGGRGVHDLASIAVIDAPAGFR